MKYSQVKCQEPKSTPKNSSELEDIVFEELESLE